jgi:hypothetical protein
MQVITLRLAQHGARSIENIVDSFTTVFLISALSMLAYYSDAPSRWTDFDRITIEMKNASSAGLLYFIQLYPTQPFSGVILYLIQSTGQFRLIKSLAAFIFYSAFFFIMGKLRDRNASRGAILFCTLLYISFQDFAWGLTDNIRYYPSAAVFAACLINREFFNGKKVTTHCLLILCCLTHAGLWPIYLMYLISHIQSKKILIIAMIGTLTYTPALLVIARFLPTTWQWKVALYFDQNSQWHVNDVSNEQTLFYMASLCLELFILIYWYRTYSRDNKNLPSYQTYITTLTLLITFSIGSLSSNILFVRMVPTLFMMLIPVSVQSLSNYLASYKDDSCALCSSKTPPLYQHLFFLTLTVFAFAAFFLRLFFSYADYSV